MRNKTLMALAAVLTLVLSASADVTIQSPNQPTAVQATSVTTTSASAATVAATTSVTVGSSTPTAITNIRVYSLSCTPSATSAAIQTSVQSCTGTGLETTDKIVVNGPAPTSLCPLVHARVSAQNTLSLHFSVLTAAACTPAAGTYLVVAFRS